MFRMKIVASIIAVVLLSLSAFAANPVFYTIDNPADPTFNQLLGINKAGVISGYFGSGQAGHPNIGYTVAPPYAAANFVPDNLPGSVQTQATGIATNGTTVGFWAPTNNGLGLGANFGFIRQANGFTYLSVNNPLGGSSPQVDQLLGINASNVAVGFYNDATGASHGYAYSVKTGVYTPVDVTGAVSDVATGINAHNQVCGFFTMSDGITEGFVQALGNGGIVTTFAVPGSGVTQLLGINDSGFAVGFYVDANAITHGLTYNPVNGDWKTLDDPNGVGGTVLNGINDIGEAVGFYTDAAGNTHGMLVTGVK
jgi:hypothetical protein